MLKVKYNLLGGGSFSFETIDEKSYDNVYAVSDLHGDILLLLVLLRDCMGVVKKKGGATFHDTFDLELDSTSGTGVTSPGCTGLLHLDFDDPNYPRDLNYEWVAENTCVVVVGDLLDNFRKNRSGVTLTLCEDSDPDRRYGEYLHEELKLVAFLNEMNKQATARGSRVIKLAGNHEHMNLVDDESVMYYVSGFSRKNPWMGMCRTAKDLDEGYFYRGKPGGKLLLEGGLGAVVKVNDFIFVHGALYTDTTATQFPPLQYEGSFVHTADLINRALYYEMTNKSKNYTQTTKDNMRSVLWTRDLGDPKKYLTCSREVFCQHIAREIQEVCNRGADPDPCLRNVRLVVGHCPQNAASHLAIDGEIVRDPTTFGTLVSEDREDRVCDVISVDVVTAPVQLPSERHKAGVVYGITVDCGLNRPGEPLEFDDNRPRLFRVDVASSRAMDGASLADLDESDKERVFRNLVSKLPQCLHITGKRTEADGRTCYQIFIRRSTLENATLHQPRKIPEPLRQSILERRFRWE